ncbi:MAG: NADH-quinone oxidoreductase subunit B family protein [Candidatus Thorarchaeota archaeon]
MNALKRSRLKSPWVFQLNTGSCNGCDIEIVAALAPRYDIEQLGCQLVGTPRHADVLLVTGPMTRQMVKRAMRVYDQVPEPKVVVAIGACAISTGPFFGSDMVEGPVDRLLPVDAYVPGCPPSPDAIMEGVVMAISKKYG